MDCLLIRHGIAIDRAAWDAPDEERPLTPKGAEKTRRAALGLRRLGLKPTHLLSSPLVRAVETAKILQTAFRLKEDDLQPRKELLPEAPWDRLLHLLVSLPPAACVLCVGHEPHLSRTAGGLLFGASSGGLMLKKAGACCIRFEGVPKAGEGLLRWWLMPSQLRALAGA
jgi:phosphohistidine phosphatase